MEIYRALAQFLSRIIFTSESRNSNFSTRSNRSTLGMPYVLSALIASIGLMPKQASANNHEDVFDPIFYCKSSLDPFPQILDELFGEEFYIVTPDLNLVMSDGNLFLGGASFYFSNGRLEKQAKFMVYSKEEALERGILGKNLILHDTIATASNIVTKAPSEFDITLSGNGWAPRDRPEWKGHCQQVSEADSPAFRELRDKAEHARR